MRLPKIRKDICRVCGSGEVEARGARAYTRGGTKSGSKPCGSICESGRQMMPRRIDRLASVPVVDCSAEMIKGKMLASIDPLMMVDEDGDSNKSATHINAPEERSDAKP